jgi:integrase/recombinase XerD
MIKTTDDLIAEFEAWLAGKDISRDTLKDYPRHVRDFCKFFHGDLLSVDEEILEGYVAYLKRRGVTQNSVKRYFTGISNFFKFLVKRKYITVNPAIPVQEDYLKSYKTRDVSQLRQVITVDDAKKLVASILDPRERAIILLFLKTGIRNHELVELDVNDVDLPNLTVYLHPTAKRSNLEVYIDEETARTLKRWLKVREKENVHNIPALFLDRYGNRLTVRTSSYVVRKHAISAGLHDQSSKLPRDRLSPHNFRYYFTNRMLDYGMRPLFVQYLRGDAVNNAMGSYIRFDKAEVKREYLGTVPKLGL